MVTLRDILELIDPDSSVEIIYDKNKSIGGTAYNRVSPYLNTPVKAISEHMDDIVIELKTEQAVPELKSGQLVKLRSQKDNEPLYEVSRFSIVKQDDRHHIVPRATYNDDLTSKGSTIMDIVAIYEYDHYDDQLILVWERDE